MKKKIRTAVIVVLLLVFLGSSARVLYQFFQYEEGDKTYSEAAAAASITGEHPVMLLDDVLSELDTRRQTFVLNRIRGGQVFITCCEEEKLEGLEGGRAFHIQGGKLI